MAELTILDEKLAEVLRLAQAQIEERCDAAASTREGMKTAIGKKARETKAEVTGFMKTSLEDAEALDGLEFLSMAESGEMRTGRSSARST